MNYDVLTLDAVQTFSLLLASLKHRRAIYICTYTQIGANIFKFYEK